jgi:RNA recognition motif-containing protein
LVGSSLELEQRLDEPIPPHPAHVASASSLVEDTNSPMHTFDIKKTPASLATWREHEAYTSKVLRKSPSPSPSNLPAIPANGDRTCPSSDTLFVGNLSFDTSEDIVSKAFSKCGTVLGVRLPTDRFTGNYKGFGYVTFSSVNEAKAALENMQGAEINGRACRLDFSQPSSSYAPTMCPPFVPAAQGQPDLPVSLEEAIKGALQGLETQVGAFAGFLQDTSNTLRTAAENTREADVSAIGGILDGFKGIFSEVAKVGKAMVEAFEAEAFAHSPSVSPAVAEDSITKKPAIEGREAKCPSDSNAVPATGQRENTLASSLAVAKATEPSPSSTMPPTSSRVPVTDHKVLKKPETFDEKLEEVRGGSSVHARASEAASYADELWDKESTAPFAAYASLKNPWNVKPPKRPDQDVGCNYCQIRKVVTLVSTVSNSPNFHVDANISLTDALQEKLLWWRLRELSRQRATL